MIELRREPERDLGHIGVTIAGAAGHAVAVELDGRSGKPGSFERFSQLSSASVVLPAGAQDEVSVWAHRVSPDGRSTEVPATVVVAGHHISIAPQPGGPT